MLGRLNLHAVEYYHREELRTHIERVYKIKLEFGGDKFTKKPNVSYSPSCHVVARGYAKAFGVQFCDGIKSTIKPIFPWLTGVLPNYKYGHSWNMIFLGGDFPVVLDLHPEETCSMLPIMMPYKESRSYYRPGPKKFLSEVSREMKALDMQREIDLMAEEFLRIDKL